MNTQTLLSPTLKGKSTASSLKPPTHSFSPHPSPREEYFQFPIWLELLKSDPNAGRDWGQEEKGMTEDEMVGWHHQLDGHEFEQALGVSDGQGGLAGCSPWGCKKSDKTVWKNWTKLNWKLKKDPWEAACVSWVYFDSNKIPYEWKDISLTLWSCRCFQG